MYKMIFILYHKILYKDYIYMNIGNFDRIYWLFCISAVNNFRIRLFNIWRFIECSGFRHSPGTHSLTHKSRLEATCRQLQRKQDFLVSIEARFKKRCLHVNTFDINLLQIIIRPTNKQYTQGRDRDRGGGERKHKCTEYSFLNNLKRKSQE